MIIQASFKLCKYLYELFCFVVSPPLCFACRGYLQDRVVLCLACEAAIDLIAPKMFPINESYVLTVFCVSRYTEPLRPMLFAKYRSDEIVLEKLADIIWHKSALSLVSVDCLVPIPLHWSRNLKRGFNQAELIANRLSLHSGIPVVNALSRQRRTEYQVRVDHADRAVNIKHSMGPTMWCEQLQGKHIMLVDDSCTTGATAIEAAKVLVKYKPASINMIVACRAL